MIFGGGVVRIKTIPQSQLALSQPPEGELAVGQERLAWAITQGGLGYCEISHPGPWKPPHW